MPKAYVILPSCRIDGINRLPQSSHTHHSIANKREFIKLCQAVGLGFVVMGAIGYFIRIIHIPVNQILVS
jgi:hypothetical protein